MIAAADKMTETKWPAEPAMSSLLLASSLYAKYSKHESDSVISQVITELQRIQQSALKRLLNLTENKRFLSIVFIGPAIFSSKYPVNFKSFQVHWCFRLCQGHFLPGYALNVFYSTNSKCFLFDIDAQIGNRLFNTWMQFKSFNFFIYILLKFHRKF